MNLDNGKKSYICHSLMRRVSKSLLLPFLMFFSFLVFYFFLPPPPFFFCSSEGSSPSCILRYLTVLQGGRAWSISHSFWGRLVQTQMNLARIIKPLAKPYRLQIVSMHFVSSGERTWCIKGRCVGAGGLKLSLWVSYLSFWELVFSYMKEIRIRDFQRCYKSLK